MSAKRHTLSVDGSGVARVRVLRKDTSGSPGKVMGDLESSGHYGIESAQQCHFQNHKPGRNC